MRIFNLPFVIFLSILFVCCSKENISKGYAESNLIRIEGDSIGIWNFIYTDNKISDLYAKRPFVSDSVFHYATFEYPEHNTLKAFASNKTSYVEYYLNDSGLPLRIVRQDVESNSEMKFSYNQETNLLDSVVDQYNWHTSHDYTKYTFQYENSNIVKLIRKIKYSDQQFYIDTFSYTYDESPNAFQKANPLLYIFSNPFAEMTTFNMIPYFPEIFSANTITSYTIPLNGVWFQDKPRTVIITHTATADGKILTLENLFNNRQFFCQ
jgi:hypothetical protein